MPGDSPHAVAPGDRRRVAPLFAGHAELRAVLDAALEGRVGSALAAGDPPRAARLSLGCYEFFGGDPAAPPARSLVEGARAERELVYGNDPAWRALLIAVHGARVFDRPMRSFDAAGLSAGHLRPIADGLAAGFALRRFDARLARSLDAELVPHALQVYADAEDFAAHGIGFGALDGERLACAATSYTRSAGAVEVAIATRPAYRGRGLAAAVAARLMLECLELGLTPCWNASNPISQRLALRLGYGPGGTCEVLYLR
jgi:GNAT superfamily N-acetyltransferase